MTFLSTLHSRFDTVGTSKSYDVLHSSGTSVLIPVMYDTNILVHIFYHDDYQFNKKKKNYRPFLMVSILDKTETSGSYVGTSNCKYEISQKLS